MRVLKFGAVWCSGCSIMKPIWEEIEKENPWLETDFFDYDENRKIFKKYNVDKKLPCFIFFNNKGKEFLRLNGEISKKELIKIIQENK